MYKYKRIICGRNYYDMNRERKSLNWHQNFSEQIKKKLLLKIDD